ncbi:hypothetical protein [Streptomyces sp. NBC_01465]|uniref:hypothetical protein n=1 Tax=Streptomyces sp. NBC_01465 TaxID=2903878 RepID=UPI002E2EBD3C|nr:hypothetical protein [Streptomyces sp. NBC_01465]
MPRRVTVRLDTGAERVTRAQRTLINLGAALVIHPFDPVTHDKLRPFLMDEAAGVLASLRVLELRPEAQLRERIAELTGRRLEQPSGGAA